MKTILLDTNVLLRLVLKDTPSQYKESYSIVYKSGSSILYVSQIIVFEIAFILDKYYKFEKEKVVDALKFILDVDQLTVESKKILITAVRVFEDNNVSFVDSFLVARAKSTGFELKTFDKRLKKLI